LLAAQIPKNKACPHHETDGGYNEKRKGMTRLIHDTKGNTTVANVNQIKKSWNNYDAMVQVNERDHQ